VKPTVDGERLQELRQELGLSRAELGQRARVYVRTVTRIETGEQRLTQLAPGPRRRIAEVLGLPIQTVGLKPRPPHPRRKRVDPLPAYTVRDKRSSALPQPPAALPAGEEWKQAALDRWRHDQRDKSPREVYRERRDAALMVPWRPEPAVGSTPTSYYVNPYSRNPNYKPPPRKWIAGLKMRP
jgi:transcriptional regulator with XRE-family HTH domain